MFSLTLYWFLFFFSSRKGSLLKGNRSENAIRALELCESRGGRPGLRVPNSPYGVCGRKATLSCVRVEVAVLGSASLIVLTVSVDVKQQ